MNNKLGRESMSLNQSGMKNQGSKGSRILSSKHNSSQPGMLPMVKGLSEPLQMSRDKEFPGLSILQSRAPQGINGSIGQGLGHQERSLERNPSVLSRKELIKQEYNLLLETRLPNIMQLMNSDKSLGLGMGSLSKNNLETDEDSKKNERLNK
jgi:hypothetical protein